MGGLKEQSKQNSAAESMARALEALAGLAAGDAFGGCFLDLPNRAPENRAARILPPGPWRFTGDTITAVSVCACLHRHGGIEPEWLAESFARHYDPERAYGSSMNALLMRLTAIGAANWFEEAQELFNGEGSFGNGAATRVAPVGAHFSYDLKLPRIAIRRVWPALSPLPSQPPSPRANATQARQWTRRRFWIGCGGIRRKALCAMASDARSNCPTR